MPVRRGARPFRAPAGFTLIELMALGAGGEGVAGLPSVRVPEQR